MTPAARISAAIDVLADIEARRRPATDALKDWGLSHRFAGSGDRAAIAGLVYDALRRKASAAHLLGEATPRATVLGMLRLDRGLDLAAVEKLCDGSRFAPDPLDARERAALAGTDLVDAPAHVAGDYPEWLDLPLARVFGDDRVEEGRALAQRAPLDLRVNTLAADRDKLAGALSHLRPAPTRWSPAGLRVVVGAEQKSPPVHAEPAFIKGQVEIQDEGSQVAALIAAARPGEQVIDLCAGGGGKTLALAATMENKGQLYATDLDKRRLAPIHARLERAGVRNVQVRTPGRETDVLEDVSGRADLVLVDAPCTGTGTWRRNPDAKWRIRPGSLSERLAQQATVLDRAAGLVRPGGRVVYVTCSLLADENTDQIQAFLARHPGFSPVPPEEAVTAALGDAAPAFLESVLTFPEGLLMTPRRTGTDGFFVSVLRREE
ncbi:RsmB/NOP family class I SAM-dependent RNA methyltransferase [Rhodoplanes sp. TEM]|uniref:RsmB/NOP family class I SAM-dependent RNA methyltransferase n=1 Tax=Rhodoplanes tepidamans TaxID=200616 RepID=A0ABT5JHM9_RHOTP|nr:MULTISPECIES: RsmB/NOP family class I SAM-dependent RNA methyltransferase [Rhodoplanes]MDC7789008.1 RsmB/NOP family class I SAM-dependent RNA methyltransferase [Rhodoplanes tepidamans]MDC7986400.1 RsmB/NOP family class I SAM-dependent RNA methyltransferase [Rhodoplanes sp. TEM]MDQ0355721.1 16S rRNA (cytosine967-C5)-methyltransferase [Rhodoplanes tepidamans]